MAEKYSHDELVERLDEPGWRAVTGDTSQEGTLRQVTDALQLEKLWYYLGLPLA